MRGGWKGGGKEAWLVTAGAVSCIDLLGVAAVVIFRAESGDEWNVHHAVKDVRSVGTEETMDGKMEQASKPDGEKEQDGERRGASDGPNYGAENKRQRHGAPSVGDAGLV